MNVLKERYFICWNRSTQTVWQMDKQMTGRWPWCDSYHENYVFVTGTHSNYIKWYMKDHTISGKGSQISAQDLGWVVYKACWLGVLHSTCVDSVVLVNQSTPLSSLSLSASLLVPCKPGHIVSRIFYLWTWLSDKLAKWTAQNNVSWLF